MNAQIQPQATQRPAFGSVLTDTMAVATYANGKWSDHELRKTGPIEISPAAHVLHYASTCFEGFKAYRRRTAASTSSAWIATSSACARAPGPCACRSRMPASLQAW